MLIAKIFDLLVFAFGASIGSFANVVIYRLPRDKSLVSPGSQCPTCNKDIRWYDLFPVISYLALRGKCRFCKAPFSWRYAFIEFLSGVLALAVWWRFGVSVSTIELFCFSLTLIIVALIDLDAWIIPLPLSIWLIVTGLIFGALQDLEMTGNGFGDEIVFRLKGGAFGFALLMSVLVIATWVFRKTGRIPKDQTALGYGDPLLFAGIGAYVGFYQLPSVLFLASAQGVIAYGIVALAGKRFPLPQEADIDDDFVPPPSAIPFGPFLALAAIEVAFFSEEFMTFASSQFLR